MGSRDHQGLGRSCSFTNQEFARPMRAMHSMGCYTTAITSAVQVIQQKSYMRNGDEHDKGLVDGQVYQNSTC